jgi:hypothetical protein
VLPLEGTADEKAGNHSKQEQGAKWLISQLPVKRQMDLETPYGLGDSVLRST